MACADAAPAADGLTPLGRRLVELIKADGPIGIDQFMAIALGDPEHGYYRTRDPLGAAGDFTTAPEISQVFGEIIGAWCAAQWRLIGAPSETLLIELGPGRGTLSADLLRALHVLPACRRSIQLHLVETSPVLRERQAALLAEAHADIPACWHESLETVPDGPSLLVANEFFDALPTRQCIRRDGTWYERRIGVDARGDLIFMVGARLDQAQSAALDAVAPAGAEGILETCPAGAEIARQIGKRLHAAPGATLIVDYGYRSAAFGDSLQAVREHRYVGPLDEPGEADLTTHVDFSALKRALEIGGAMVSGPIDQRDFLIENGALLRSEVLQRRGDVAATIRRGVDRLLDPQGMGTLFQVLAATSPGVPRPVGFG